jgi:hypothetical protein
MSLFSKDVWDPLKAFIGQVTKAAGADASSAGPLQQAQASADSARSAVIAAEQDLLAAIPAAAEVAVNYVLGLIPGGAAFEPIADSFIAEVIAQLAAKKPAAQPA